MSRAPEPADGPTDRELAGWHARARVGDAVARDRVVALLYPHIRAVLRRRFAGYPADVRGDALQEAIVRVSDQLSGCRATTAQQLIGWAGVVGWRAAVRYLRSPAAGLATGLNALDIATVVAAAEGALALDPEADHEVEHDVAGEEAAGESRDPDGVPPHPAPDLFATGALAEVLAGALAELPAGSAAVLWLRAADRRSYREIAAAHGITPAAAKRRYQRAAERLRRAVVARAAALPEPARSAVRRRLTVTDETGRGG